MKDDIVRLDGTIPLYEKGIMLGASGGGADENGLYVPKTRILSSINIKLNNNTDILEIEDVYFDRSKRAENSSGCVCIGRWEV